MKGVPVQAKEVWRVYNCYHGAQLHFLEDGMTFSQRFVKLCTDISRLPNSTHLYDDSVVCVPSDAGHFQQLIDARQKLAASIAASASVLQLHEFDPFSALSLDPRARTFSDELCVDVDRGNVVDYHSNLRVVYVFAHGFTSK